MHFKILFLFFLGLCAGGIIAAGVFAFLAMIGVFPRIVGKTNTRNRILLYETCIVLGGIFGNFADIYKIPMEIGTVFPLLGQLLLALFGLGTGIFSGCLVMSLAETVKALPVFCRRLHLSTGIQYIVLSLAAGKLAGALVYFIYGIGR